MQNNTFKMVLILTLIASLSALILAFIYDITKAPIAEAYRQEFVKGLKVVLPPFDNEPDIDFKEIKGHKVYLAKKGEETIAYAIKSISEKGYSGNIAVLVGVDLKGKVSGIEVLQHAETPGLGDKIQDKPFRDSFIGLSVKDKIAVKMDGGVIDQFSGATISPRAVAEAVTIGVEFVTHEVIEE